RACRYGMEASLVDPQTFQSIPVRKVVHRLLDRLKDRALELGCSSQLEIVRELADRPTGSVLQLETYRQTGDLAEVIRRMLRLSHLANNPVAT
ncbi:MAG: carboxylate-amine ligase, partial [Isosphaeraceae bacterium]